jgi:hypothetical protein
VGDLIADINHTARIVMAELTHIRKAHLILTVKGVLVEDCKTINSAKRYSRLIQKSGAVVREDRTARPGPTIKRKYTGYAAKKRAQSGKLTQWEVRGKKGG